MSHNGSFTTRTPVRPSKGVSASTLLFICAVAALGSAGVTTYVLNTRHASVVGEIQERRRMERTALTEDLETSRKRQLTANENVDSCKEGVERFKHRLDETEIRLEEAHVRVEHDSEAAAASDQEIKNLNEEILALRQSKEENTEVGENREVVEKIKEENEANLKKLHIIQDQIGSISRREAVRRFGEGPHQVKILLDFPPEPALIAPDGTTPNFFVIEMASLDHMPHSVYLFLSMIEAGLWNGSSFMRLANHVLQASPRPYYKNAGQNVHQNFLDFGVHQVAFQEYSSQFPHKKYTVGFSGRPGGPDFYINRVDNILNHGPGGQTKYEKAHEADPCFAKIVDGIVTIERMSTMPVLPGAFKEMEKYVGILDAYILPSHELVDNSDHITSIN
eukprot:CAMPEP_0194281638 /NCGR_PEP_ID=MMETSP0169-20130528/21167_1 /TAXON_ID=218684 /ORGANISM="Corethron pennatum, Strain L29A3" /LENGTH=391 /DNA_ID=CAMNT_0039026749 /DNA_START=217 /DNA_END=1392 /DNA_ORIENTATION=-